jgi:cell division protein ZapA
MLRIEANIAGRTIPLKVTPEEETLVRTAIDEVNARLQQYQSEYAQKDIQDCMLMALLTYAVEHQKAQARMVDEADVRALSDIRDQLMVLESQSDD